MSTTQADYPASKQPVVLGLLHHGIERREELAPTLLCPGPRLVEVSSLDEHVESYELKVTSDPTVEEVEYCRLIQYAVYWIAEQSRDLPEEGACLNYQLIFLRDAKENWEEWQTGILTFDEFAFCIEQLLADISHDEDAEDGEDEQTVDIMTDYMAWKGLSDEVKIANETRRARLRVLQARGVTFRPPSSADRREVRRIIKYAVGAVTVLARITECNEEADRVASQFSGETSSLYGEYSSGLLERHTLVSILDIAFKGSNIVGSSIAIVSEAEKELAIMRAERRLASCSTAPAELAGMEEYDDADRCSICMCDIENEEERSITPCAHTFHTSCLRLGLLEKADCPNCRCEIR